MKTYNFTQNQKAAIVCLLILMTNIDDEVAYDEVIVTNDIWRRMGVDEETYNLGRALKYEYAVSIIRAFSTEQKICVAKLLVEVVDADGVVADNELHLLQKICDDIGVTHVFFPGEEC